MANVADKVVAITGASSGLGEATARRLSDQGAKVFLGVIVAAHDDADFLELAPRTLIVHQRDIGR